MTKFILSFFYLLGIMSVLKKCIDMHTNVYYNINQLKVGDNIVSK